MAKPGAAMKFLCVALVVSCAAVRVNKTQVDASNLAKGIVPTGSTDSHWGRFAGATDGSMKTSWHANNGDYPSWLVLELKTPSTIEGMKIRMPHHANYGFKTLEIYRSDDGKSWAMVRADSKLKCAAHRVSEHNGWAEITKYVKIVMKDRCGGSHFAILEWEVYGAPAANLAAGIVPTGSSDSKWGRFPGATDGNIQTSWHARNWEHPSNLILDLGLQSHVSGMTLLTPANSANYGFKTLKISRSMDGNNWDLVRSDSGYECKPSRLSYHPGWPQETKFVKIEMSDLCGGGAFALMDWQIFGSQNKCEGNELPQGDDRYPCDSVKDEKTCRESFIKIATGQTFQCGVRKASATSFNCLVIKGCDAALP